MKGKLSGTGVSPGIGIAPALVLHRRERVITQDQAADPKAELAHFESAHRAVLAETTKLYEKTLATMGEASAEIFDAHISILNDPELLGPIKEAIVSSHCNAPWAIKQVSDNLIALFASMDDEYMRERSADIRDIATRLIDKTMGLSSGRLEALIERRVVIAYDLSPSDTAGMDARMVAGIVTATGGRTSHAAIMARTLGIPAVVGVGAAWDSISDGEIVAVDGETAEVIAAPDPDEVAAWRRRAETLAAAREELANFRDASTVTADGRKLEILANIGTPADLELALSGGAEGVGLFRSEFLFMSRNSAPTEDEQFEAYASVLRALCGKPLTVRTLDIGGDKEIAYLGLAKEDNPFLGYRAIRLCLGEREIFRTQLRALLRASAEGDLRIMLPMISSLQELREAKRRIESAKDELRAEGVAFNEGIKVGIMVEIPAVAILADAFAEECDFFSIGTNDLIQYSVAVDRGNERIAELYTPYHPAVLRLIAMTARAAAGRGIPCAMCGEAASDELLIPVLVGLGLEELSMSASGILMARKTVAETNYEQWKREAETLLAMRTSDEAEEFLSRAKERRSVCLSMKKKKG